MDVATRVLRIGVIGVGRIGRMHADLLARRIPGATVTREHDAHEASARGVAETLGVTAAADVEELLGASDVDAVAICTPTDTHADLIVAAAQAGKAIFCEKPVSLDLATVDRALVAVDAAGVPFQIGFNRRFDPAHAAVAVAAGGAGRALFCEKPVSLALGRVDRALVAVDAAGVPFQIGFNRRFDPAHAAVAAAVADGEVGTPQLARITSRDPAPPPIDYIRTSGGIFLDMTIHDFDMARYVTGSEVVEVYARGGVRVDAEIGEAGDVDTAVVVLEHENGCLTTIDNSRQAVYGYDQRVEVFGSAGMAASENPLAHTALVRSAAGTRAATLPYFFLERYIPSYLREWEAFVAAVSAGEPTPVGARDARAPLVIGLAAWESLREGRPVRV